MDVLESRHHPRNNKVKVGGKEGGAGGEEDQDFGDAVINRARVREWVERNGGMEALKCPVDPDGFLGDDGDGDEDGDEEGEEDEIEE